MKDRTGQDYPVGLVCVTRPALANSLRQLRVHRDHDEVDQLGRRHPLDVFTGRIQVEGSDDVKEPRAVQRRQFLPEDVQISRADVEGVENRLGSEDDVGRRADLALGGARQMRALPPRVRGR